MGFIKNTLLKIFVKSEHRALSERELTPENATVEESEVVMQGMDDAAHARMFSAMFASDVSGNNPYSEFKPHLRRAWQLGYDLGMSQPMDIDTFDDGSAIGNIK